ncbi:STAS domain-containing protein [Hymenobacter sp. BRD67]|uniref:STAS domain-containing protein n=1 Tax=Hymenobacter sp. BRD67 TaxID=2675877 RepID=UPI001563C71B|nr:STAS domain-containing protein [Hymenobacter sp. BRD67]QKG54137.1 STAS domain-containing protein [Hymenobacter sp. BRD67]
MNNAFFLLILPSRSLTIHFGSHRQCVGLSLRGSCTSTTDATHLLSTVQQLLERHPTQAWIDTQQLHSLSLLGRQALLRADACCRRAGTEVYWCGMPSPLVKSLQASGLAHKLKLRPAAAFKGPSFLLPERKATGLSIA